MKVNNFGKFAFNRGIRRLFLWLTLVRRVSDSFRVQRNKDSMSGWYSLAGFLHLKFLGGAFTYLKPKRRYYFVLDEANCQLAYFKDEAEFIRKKDPIGQIDLKNCAVSLSDTNKRAFIIHAVGGRQYELEAENDQSALVWLSCLQHRKDENKQRQLSVFHNALDAASNSSGSAEISRCHSSASLPSDHDMATMLDCAFKSSMHKHQEQATNPNSCPPICSPLEKSTSPNTKNYQSNLSFYFGPETGSVGSTEDGPNPPDPEHSNSEASKSAKRPSEKVEFSLSGERKMSNSKNAEHLQSWIRNWLSGQDQLDDTNDNDRALEEAAPSPSFDIELRELREEMQKMRNRELTYKYQLQKSLAKIKDLNRQLNDVAEVCQTSDPNVQNKYLQNQNKFLNSEIARLSLKWQDEKGQYGRLSKRVSDLESELDAFKQEYVYLLQSCIRIPLGEKYNAEIVEIKLFGGDVHKYRVMKLLQEARLIDPTLPTFDSLRNGNCHVDVYGFRHSFTEEALALHYICTQLHQHYQSQLASQQQHKHRWKLYLARSKNILVNNKETRTLVRNGIPPAYRSAVWRCLIHQQVVDMKLKFGKYYFRNLCSSQHSEEIEFSATHQKQITLDLLRTMPNNVHFSSAACKGVNQLQQLLRAFCLHNPKIGYCQGMNFIAATCLLFLSPEDTFWFLVALTERYFVGSYFDSNLTGAQADQEVLKELLEHKLSRLAEHLNRSDIDLATVTLNWFLALFFDAVPFQTMLRVWDCFLLEGPKVLFRFALALLYLHEDTVMERTDTISVMKVLKAAARLTYDTDGLVKLAFEGMKPFPHRQELASKQACYLGLLKERLRKKEELKAAFSVEEEVCRGSMNKMPMETIVPCPNSSISLIAFGHQNCGRLSLIDTASSEMSTLSVEFECRIISVAVCDSQLAFVSLISAYLVAVSLAKKPKVCKRLWELKLTDVPLSLVYHENRLFAALANGSLAVIENAAEKTPNFLELYYIPIGPAPLATVSVVSDQQLWCAMGSKAVILNTKTLDCLEHLYVAASMTGGCVSFFEKILCFQPSPLGVWLATAHSGLVQLWDPSTFTCRLLFDITADHKAKHGPPDQQEHEALITALLFHEQMLWVGTADGYLIMYDVVKKLKPSGSSGNLPRNLSQNCATPSQNGRYLIGRRISPENATSRSLYIPGKQELPTPAPSEGGKETNVVSMITAKTSVETCRDSGYGGSVGSGNGAGNSHTPSGSGSQHSLQVEDATDLCVDRDDSSRRFFSRSSVANRSKSFGSLHSSAAGKVARKRRENLERTQSSPNKEDTQDISKKSEAPQRKISAPMARQRHLSGDNGAGPRRGSFSSAQTSSNVGIPAHMSRPHAVEIEKLLVQPIRSCTDLAELENEGRLKDAHAQGTGNSRPPPANPSLFQRLKASASFSSVHSLQSDSFEYDDLFFLYSETEDESSLNSRPQGGLCSAKLSKTESVWSLNAEGLPWSVEDYLEARRKESSGEIQQISEYTNRPNSLKLRRKDLQFDESENQGGDSLSDGDRWSPGGDKLTISGGNYFAASETASVISMASSIEAPFAYSLHLQMKLKISDKSVKCLTVARSNDEDVILSCAGNYGDEEAVLRWKRETKTNLWINDPLVDEVEVRNRRNRRILSSTSSGSSGRSI